MGDDSDVSGAACSWSDSTGSSIPAHHYPDVGDLAKLYYTDQKMNKMMASLKKDSLMCLLREALSQLIEAKSSLPTISTISDKVDKLLEKTYASVVTHTQSSGSLTNDQNSGHHVTFYRDLNHKLTTRIVSKFVYLGYLMYLIRLCTTAYLTKPRYRTR